MFSGNVGAYCIRPTKRPAKGVGVYDKRARGVCFCALHGSLSDNRFNMEKRNTDSSPFAPNITPRQPFKSDFSAGRVGGILHTPYQTPCKGRGGRR